MIRRKENPIMWYQFKSLFDRPAASGVVLFLAALGAMIWQSVSDDPNRAWVLVGLLGGAWYFGKQLKIIEARNRRR